MENLNLNGIKKFMHTNKSSRPSKENNKVYTRLLNSTESLSLEDLNKEGLNLYYEKVNREEFILDGMKEKRLKSKALILEGKKIANKRKKQKEVATDGPND